MSFVINYTMNRVTPPSRAAQFEKHCLTRNAALNFCVEVSQRGGKALELVQLIQGREDAVLDGSALDQAIARQRERLEAPVFGSRR